MKKILLFFGFILLLLVVAGLIFLKPPGQKTAMPQKDTPVAQVVTNPAPTAAHWTNNAIASPGVAELLKRMQDWRAKNPQYHLLIETTGPDIASTAEVFRFQDEKGVLVNRVKTHMRQPSPLEFTIASDGQKVQAYFPGPNQVVNIEAAEEAAAVLSRAGLAGDFDSTVPLKLARAAFAENGPDYTALTLVFPHTAFQMPRAAGELFLTIHVGPDGRALQLEQLTLGVRVVSKITYIEEQVSAIKEKAPAIPASATASSKTFKQILQEQVNGKKPTAI